MNAATKPHLGRSYFQVGALRPNGSREVGFVYTALGVHATAAAARQALRHPAPGDVVFIQRGVHAYRGGCEYGLTAAEVVYEFSNEEVRADLL